MKTEPAKTVPITSLRNVTSTMSPRFIAAPVSSSINTVPLTIQNAGGKPITIPSSGGQPGQKSDVTIAVLPVANRIISSGTPTTGYHVPRGPAAVANISIPRGSLATPIRSGGSTIATSGNNATFMPGLSVLRPLGAGPWIVTTSGITPPTSIRPITSTVAPSNFISSAVRHGSMTVAAKITTGARMQSDQHPRPQTVLLQKQIITGSNTPQMVHVTDGNKSFIKTALPLPLRAPSPRLLSTTTPGGKLPVFPILVSSGSSILKTGAQPQLGSKMMVSQASHGTPIQITSVPNPTSTKPSGFQLSSNSLTSTTPSPSSQSMPVSLSGGKPSVHPVIVSSTPGLSTSNVSSQNLAFGKYPNIINTSNSSSFTPTTSNTSYYYETPNSSSPSVSHPPSSSPSIGGYTLPPNSTGPPSTGAPSTSAPIITGAPPMGVRHPSSFAPVTSLNHPPRPNQTSTIISAPRGVGGGLSHFSLPTNRYPGPQPSVLVASRISGPHLITSSSGGVNSGSSAIVTTGPTGVTRFNPISASAPVPIIHEAISRQSSLHGGATTFVPVSCEGSGDESPSVQGSISSSTVNKPNASPRPSILRKREIDPSVPMKAQKNLTPMLNAPPSSTACSISANLIASINNTAINASNLPPSPSSPPKRPDSGGGSSSQSSSSSTSSSGGSSTASAPPIDPLDPTAPPPLPHHEPHESEPNMPHPPTSALISGLSLSNCPVEMSPRKKPRKQLLTGDLQERKMEVEDMEFITEEKIKSEHHREENGGDLHGSTGVSGSGVGSGGHPLPLAPPHTTPLPPASPASKKPHVSLLHSYRQGWKSRHHHFMRYSDVKPKDERRPSLSDIASQKHILQKVNGWKIYHLRTQMENMATSEKEHSSKLTCLLETFEKKYDSSDREVNRVNELIKGNIQRNNVVQDQLLEAHGHLMKIFEHKNTVSDLITKNGNRRTIKKKDKY
ncbi:hypothetical protein M8J77_005674 [Diaphorina citri]|nr:hypothetical protein M8J77_005674 [Diaphorina citri]